MALAAKITVLLGGVGGAKLAEGLAAVLPGRSLTFIVNTGDDFWHLGLKICPDMDTLVYTLAGIVDRGQGWGMRDETTYALESLARHYGLEPWFRLGDSDLATHLLRSQWLRNGMRLTEVAAELASRLGVDAAILPMCDEDMPTIARTADQGELGFQEYFVKHRWQPVLRGIRHAKRERATLSPEVERALAEADLVLIAPSNPWLSIAPILAVPGLRDKLTRLNAPVVAVTPIIAGAAVKGPTAKIMRELKLEVSAASVARYYGAVLDGFVDDIRNQACAFDGLRALRTNTLMRDESDKAALARAILEWIEGWRA